MHENNKLNNDSILINPSYEQNNDLLNDIAAGEIFRVREDLNNDPNAVFVEFSSSLALEKLLNLDKSTQAEKLSYTKHLGDLISNLGEEGVKNLNKIFTILIQENDEIKFTLLSQISTINSFLQKRESGYAEIINIILPVLSELLCCENLNIKEGSGEEISKISNFLSEEDRGKYVLTLVLGMAHNDINENDRIVAVQLLSKMSKCFGKDLCEQFVGLELLSLGEDPQVKVRKETIIHLPNISQIVSPLFYKQRFFPFYLNLSNDTSWSVRKACVEIIVNISEMSEGFIRETTLTNLILNFLKDSNQWVKIAAYKMIGPFIYTLEGLNINEILIEQYSKMLESLEFGPCTNNEIAYACSFNFPAVLKTVGAEKWPLLSQTFQHLLQYDSEVKRPLAYSLHEIAKLIGEKYTKNDLFTVLTSFLKDYNDEIKYGVLKNISNFIKVYSISETIPFIEIIMGIQKEYKKWRIRELLAQQIDSFAIIFPIEFAYKTIIPLSLQLCEDPVFIVRKKAAKKIGKILVFYEKEQEIFFNLIEKINSFSFSSRFNLRQTFILIVEKLFSLPKILDEYFIKTLIPLAFDKIINVRLTLCNKIIKFYKKNNNLEKNPGLCEILNIFQKDCNLDIQELLKNLKNSDNKMILEEIDIKSTNKGIEIEEEKNSNNNYT